MDNWNEWSWLAIPPSLWAIAWMFRGIAQHDPQPFRRWRGAPVWKTETRTEKPTASTQKGDGETP